MKAGKYLMTLQGDSVQIDNAKKIVGENRAESVDVVESMSAS